MRVVRSEGGRAAARAWLVLSHPVQGIGWVPVGPTGTCACVACSDHAQGHAAGHATSYAHSPATHHPAQQHGSGPFPSQRSSNYPVDSLLASVHARRGYSGVSPPTAGVGVSGSRLPQQRETIGPGLQQQQQQQQQQQLYQQRQQHLQQQQGYEQQGQRQGCQQGCQQQKRYQSSTTITCAGGGWSQSLQQCSDLQTLADMVRVYAASGGLSPEQVRQAVAAAGQLQQHQQHQHQQHQQQDQQQHHHHHQQQQQQLPSHTAHAGFVDSRADMERQVAVSVEDLGRVLSKGALNWLQQQQPVCLVAGLPTTAAQASAHSSSNDSGDCTPTDIHASSSSSSGGGVASSNGPTARTAGLPFPPPHAPHAPQQPQPHQFALPPAGLVAGPVAQWQADCVTAAELVVQQLQALSGLNHMRPCGHIHVDHMPLEVLLATALSGVIRPSPYLNPNLHPSPNPSQPLLMLLPASRLVSLAQSIADAGVSSPTAYHHLAELLLPLLPSATTTSSTVGSNWLPPLLPPAPAGVLPTRLNAHQMVAVAGVFAARPHHHLGLFNRLAQALLAPPGGAGGKGGGGSSGGGAGSGGGGRVLEGLVPGDLAAALVAFARVGHLDAELMGGLIGEAARWLGVQAESSLLSLLLHSSSSRPSARQPQPHPLQPFTLAQLAQLAVGLRLSAPAQPPQHAALAASVCKEAAGQLLALLRAGGPAAVAAKPAPASATGHARAAGAGAGWAGAVGPAGAVAGAGVSSALSGADAPVLVELLWGLEDGAGGEGGGAGSSSLLLDTAATLLTPHVPLLPLQALLQLLEVYLPAPPTPAAALSCFTLRTPPSGRLTTLQHRPALVAALMDALIPHVEGMDVSTVAGVAQRVAAAAAAASPADGAGEAAAAGGQTRVQLMHALCERGWQYLTPGGHTPGGAVRGGVAGAGGSGRGGEAGGMYGEGGDRDAQGPVTVECAAALPNAACLVVACAAQGYRHDALLAQLDRVLVAVTAAGAAGAAGAWQLRLPPAQLAGLAAAYAQLGAGAPGVLQAATASTTSTTPNHQLPKQTQPPQQALLGAAGSQPAADAAARLLELGLTLPLLAHLMWAMLVMPQARPLPQSTHTSLIQHPGTPPRPGARTSTSTSTSGTAALPAATVPAAMAVDWQGVLQLYAAALNMEIADIFDPGITLLAEVHMLLLAKLGPSFDQPLLAAGSPDAGNKLGNSLRYAWEHHLHARGALRAPDIITRPLAVGTVSSGPTSGGIAGTRWGGQGSGVEGGGAGGSGRANGGSSGPMPALDSRALQAQVLTVLRQAAETGGSGAGAGRQQLARSARAVVLSVEGFNFPVDCQVETSGHVVALACNGTDRYACTSADLATPPHTPLWAPSSSVDVATPPHASLQTPDREAAEGDQKGLRRDRQLGQGEGQTLLGEHLWRELLLRQLGWSVVQVPFWDWQVVTSATGGTGHGRGSSGMRTAGGGQRDPGRDGSGLTQGAGVMGAGAGGRDSGGAKGHNIGGAKGDDNGGGGLNGEGEGVDEGSAWSEARRQSWARGQAPLGSDVPGGAVGGVVGGAGPGGRTQAHGTGEAAAATYLLSKVSSLLQH